MARYAFDIETNAVDFNDLKSTLKTIHCLVMMDVDTEEVFRFNDKTSPKRIVWGLKRLAEADELIGQNIVGFDIPAIQVLYPWFKPKGKVTDTRVLSKLIYPDLRERDFAYAAKHPEFPKQLIGQHSLEAWGHRLGDYKDDFSKRMEALGLDPWGTLPPEYEKEREDYCEQDVRVNVKQYRKFVGKGFSESSIELEHAVRAILNRQEAFGFMFDEEAAAKLYATLAARREELTRKLKEMFPPFFLSAGKHGGFKKDMRRFERHPCGAVRRKVKVGEFVQGFYVETTKGAPYQPIKLVEFNPSSRDHIANRLQRVYGWKPGKFGEDGKPTVDEAVLDGLNYPPVEMLKEYLLVEKRIGQIAEGKQAWLKLVRNGRIHGRVDTMGAVTSRMSHDKPNVAQTPAVSSPYGKECRALFIVPHGTKLVGCDADALELRLLAGYMAKWDNGDYIRVVLNGRKEDGTDIHSRNRDAIGLKSRDAAKTWFYAFIYGAGDYKLGTIILSDMDGNKPKTKKAIVTLGKKSRANFMKNLPALGKLSSKVRDAAVKRKRIRGLDGRYHPVRSDHAALNTLLQGAGAIIMKRALVIADEEAQSNGWVPGVDYEWVANIHDELQAQVREDVAEEFGKMVRGAIIKAGEYYGFACPMDGEFKIGNNWAETH